MAHLLKLLALYTVFFLAVVYTAPVNDRFRGVVNRVVEINRAAAQIGPNTLIYRQGGKPTATRKDVFGGAVRPQDWNLVGGSVHPSREKGLSTNRDRSQIHGRYVYSIKVSEVKGDFAVKHDGKDVSHDKNAQDFPTGHSTILYIGEKTLTPADLKLKLNSLDWKVVA